jgi:hypothetical protein
MHAAHNHSHSHSVSQTRRSQSSGGSNVSLSSLTLLREGSRSPQVARLQNLLKRQGADVSTNGVFDEKTEKAVRAYQKKNNLEVDRLVGQQTWSSLLGMKPVPPGTNLLRQPAPSSSGGSTGGASTDPAGNVSSNFGGSNSQKLQHAMEVARKMGLTITSTTGGTHAPGSYHYQARAIDVAGSPSAMARFYRYFQNKSPTELFYDPLGGIKHGQQIGAIGGHGDHVHVAF